MPTTEKAVQAPKDARGTRGNIFLRIPAVAFLNQMRYRTAYVVMNKRQALKHWSHAHRRGLSAAWRIAAMLAFGADVYLFHRALLGLSDQAVVPAAPAEACYSLLCFVPLDIHLDPRIFGFSEFIASLTLMALVWTIADVRYRFRISVAPSDLHTTTFLSMVSVGALSLSSEVWQAQGWWVPKTAGISLPIWQGSLGLMFFGSFATWL